MEGMHALFDAHVSIDIDIDIDIYIYIYIYIFSIISAVNNGFQAF